MNNPQNYLDNIAAKDEFLFLKDLVGQNWANHRILLLLALELTAGSSDKVVEYGSGTGSTEYLRDFCLAHGRDFITYESNMEWAEKTGSTFIEDWGNSNVFDGKFSVAFVDAAPGEIRTVMLDKLTGKAEIIVIHDSEIGGSGDYKIEDKLKLFTYRINYNLTQGGAGVTAVSNMIDLNQFDKCTLNGFLLEA